MICPCCGKEWNTDLHNSCICGAVITQKAPQNLPEAERPQGAQQVITDSLSKLKREIAKSKNKNGGQNENY